MTTTPKTFGPWLCDNCGAHDPHCDFIERGESMLCYVCDEESREPEESDEHPGYIRRV